MNWFSNMDTIGGWLVQSTFQAVVLIMFILLIKLLFKKRLTARWHYALWILLLVRMVLPWGLSSEFGLTELLPSQAKQSAFNFVRTDLSKFSMSIPKEELALKQIDVGSLNPHQSGTLSKSLDTRVDQEAGTVFSGVRVADLLLGIWLLGILVLGVAVFAANLKLWLALRRDRKLEHHEALALLEECKRDLGIKTSVIVLETDLIKTPALFGFLSVKLLLPIGFVESLSMAALRHIFLHELAHIKRRDVFVGWVTTFLQIVHWFNPLVWFAFGRMRSDRELATDGLALSIMNPNEPVQYGHTIIQMLKLYKKTSRLPAMTGVLEQNSQVKRRMEMISNFKKNSYKWSPVAIVVLMILGCMSLPEADLDIDENKETPVEKKVSDGKEKQPAREQKPCISDGLKEKLLGCKLKEKHPSPVLTEQCDVKSVGTKWDKAVKLHVKTVGNEKKEGTLDKVVMNQAVGLYDELLACANLDKLQIKGLDEDDRPTRNRAAFYKADLLFELREWEKCGDAYYDVISLDPDGEFYSDAVYAEVLCRNKAWTEAHPEKDSKAKEEIKPSLMSKKFGDQEKKLVKSQSRFICLDPKNKEAINVKYRRARHYYEANRFEEAAVLFAEVVRSHPENELAAFSANLELDSLNALGRLVENPNPACNDQLKKSVELFSDTTKAPGTHLMKNQEFSSQLKNL